MEILLIVGAIVLILVFYVISARNTFVKQEVKIEESFSGIDVALEKRYDVLTKMYSICKKYMEYEQSTLENVIALRKGNVSDKTKADQIMTDLQDKVNITFEQYPDLKASNNVAELQASIQEVEDQLQASRRLYNANVSYMNQKVKMFPSNIIASMFNFTVKDFFEVTESKREDVVFD